MSGFPSVHVFGICDGHGQYGREVSNFVKVSLPVVIEKSYNNKFNTNKADPYHDLKVNLK